MSSSEENVELERSTALALCQRRVSGLIVVPTTSDHGYLRAEVDRGIPVVFVDRPGNGIDADAILVDNEGGAADAVAALIERGHRRIAVLLDSLDIYTMRERLSGVERAFAASGVSIDSDLIAYTAHSPENAVQAMATMLDLPEPPTAVLCGNNRSTIGAVEEIWRRSVDVDVVGFDDFEMSRLLPQAVTIVDYDTRALGIASAQRLFDRIDGDTSASRRVLLPTQLVGRGGQWPVSARR